MYEHVYNNISVVPTILSGYKAYEMELRAIQTTCTKLFCQSKNPFNEFSGLYCYLGRVLEEFSHQDACTISSVQIGLQATMEHQVCAQ